MAKATSTYLEGALVKERSMPCPHIAYSNSLGIHSLHHKILHMFEMLQSRGGPSLTAEPLQGAARSLATCLGRNLKTQRSCPALCPQPRSTAHSTSSRFLYGSGIAI
jgi:hypothetical protein